VIKVRLKARWHRWRHSTTADVFTSVAILSSGFTMALNDLMHLQSVGTYAFGCLVAGYMFYFLGQQHERSRAMKAVDELFLDSRGSSMSAAEKQRFRSN